MKRVTDPELLAQLNASLPQEARGMKKVTDPEILRQLNGMDAPAAAPRTGLGGIASDIGESLAEAPGALVEAARELPTQAALAGRQVFAHPLRATGQLGAGVLEGIKGLWNLPFNVAQYLGRRDIGIPYVAPHLYRQLSPYLEKAKIGETGLQEAVLGEDQPGESFLRGIGAFTPYTRIGRAAEGLGGLAQRAGGAAAFAAGQEYDPLQAALLGAAGEGILRGAMKLPETVSRMRPSRIVRSPLSDEQLEKALEITKGTRTGLGETIENPTLQRQYQNFLAELPGSGAPEMMQKAALEVKGRGTSILDDLLEGKNPDTVGEQLKDALIKAEKEAQAQKRTYYKNVEDRADKIGLEIDSGNLSTVAHEILEDMAKSPRLLRETSPELRNDLEFYSDPSASSKIKEANIFRGKLGGKARQRFENNDAYESGVYNALKEAVSKDIENAIDSSPDKSIKDLHKEANAFYKENIAPFDDPNILKYTRRGGDPDLIANEFLRVSSVADRANLVKKLQDKIPENQRNLLPFAYLSRAIDGEEGLNPVKMRNLYRKLGDKQKEALFEPEMKKRLDNISQLIQKNSEGLNAMFNPKTGARLGTTTTYLTSVLPGIITGARTGSIMKGALGAAAIPMLGRVYTNLLTSPTIRENLVRKMIEQRRLDPERARRLDLLLTQGRRAQPALQAELYRENQS